MVGLFPGEAIPGTAIPWEAIPGGAIPRGGYSYPQGMLSLVGLFPGEALAISRGGDPWWGYHQGRLSQWGYPWGR